MARNLNDLSIDMHRLASRLDDEASDTAVKIADAIVYDLAFNTPVDTSKALSNWRVTLGDRSNARIPPYFPGEGGSSQRASARATIDTARAVLKNKVPKQSIWISNVLPYIKRLNEGYSKQAPAGFVERAVLLARRLMQRTKVKQ